MPREAIHRFEFNGRRYAIDPETCFCFECDAISWDVLEQYPHTPINRIFRELESKHDLKELHEVLGELEWLRATKAILPKSTKERIKKEFETEAGLQRLSVELPPRQTADDTARRRWFGGKSESASPPGAVDRARRAASLLLNRSASQQNLELEFVESGGLRDADLISECCAEAQRAAALAGKKLTVSVLVPSADYTRLPPELDGHTVGWRLRVSASAGVSAALNHVAGGASASLERLARTAKQMPEGATLTVIVRPNHKDFGRVTAALDQLGFPSMELDIDGAYVADPSLVPSEMLEGLSQNAHYYAEQLVKHRYFRLDPIAALFRRVYEGAPEPRTDPAGLHEIAIDADGRIYPSWRFAGNEAFAVGRIDQGQIDEDALGGFEDVGSRTTGVCRRCWIRNLCGGGTAAVHHALTGSYRTPYEPWCEAQREWMAAAVSAFNLLSAQGVNFSRVYQSLARANSKPSLFTMVKAAFRMSVGMRPIAEEDAPLLVEWENWCESAYFLYREQGLLMATHYDREMDALHPQGVDQEFMLVRRSGEPLGLFRVRPAALPHTAEAWLWLRNEEDYTDGGVRSGLQNLLKEASQQQAISRVTVPALQRETGLNALMRALDAEHAGTIREGCFLHGGYEDVQVYLLRLDA